MADYKVIDATQLDADLTIVAEAIRSKGGTTEQLPFPQGMKQAVEAISSGGSGESVTLLPYASSICGMFKKAKFPEGTDIELTIATKNTLDTEGFASAFTYVDGVRKITLNCGDDFSTHQKIYESYFNNYQSIKVLSKGYNAFDNKDVFVDKDYYFITDLKDVNLLYHIDYNDLSIEITLYDNKRHVCDYMKVYFS